MASKSPIKLTPPEQTTHVAIVLDRSGSLTWVQADVIKVVNQQLEKVKQAAKNAGQETRVSLVTFSSYVDEPVLWEVPAEKVGTLDAASYVPTGSTALWDAVNFTIQKARFDRGSVLLIVITDGEENNSSRGAEAGMKRLIAEVNATDRWTVTFLVPSPSHASALGRYGIAGGNVSVWNAGSAEGVKKAGQQVSVSLDSYFEARKRGVTSTKSFYSPDLSGVSASTVKRELDNVTLSFEVIPVNRVAAIRDFIEDSGRAYVPGNAFYQLTKKETVQGYKEFALMDKRGDIFAGNDAARQLMGLPIGGAIELYPASASDFTVFVQSTSVNRKLMPGTKLLYRRR